MDGKTARGSWESGTNVCALTTVSLFASELRLVLSTKRLPGQGGENTLVASLLELLDLEGALVSGDAAYCQKGVAQAIHEKKGHYVLTLKANHRTLYQQIKATFDVAAVDVAAVDVPTEWVTVALKSEKYGVRRFASCPMAPSYKSNGRDYKAW